MHQCIEKSKSTALQQLCFDCPLPLSLRHIRIEDSEASLQTRHTVLLIEVSRTHAWALLAIRLSMSTQT